MVSRVSIFAYSILSYLLFLLSFLYAVGFVGNFAVPKSIDTGHAGSSIGAAVVDLLLLGLFALQHSVMARPAFKRWLTRYVPPMAERSTYVLLSSAILLLVFWQWQPLPRIVWQIDGIAAALTAAMYWVGWLIVLLSTFMIDHLELTGLQQGYAALRATAAPPPVFESRWLYRFVRHPIMLGFLVAFWFTPVMTVGHLLFASMTALYIVGGVWLEECDLIEIYGGIYERYRREVPMLVPFAPMRGQALRSDAAVESRRGGFRGSPEPESAACVASLPEQGPGRSSGK